MKKAFYLLIVLMIVGSFSLKAQDKSVTRAKESEKVWVIVNFIKDEAKADYLSWMNTYFFPALKNSKDPVIQKQYQCTRWLEPLRQNADKTWTYAFIMDPVVPNANYDITFLLKQTYGEEKGGELAKQMESYFALPTTAYALMQSKI